MAGGVNWCCCGACSSLGPGTPWFLVLKLSQKEQGKLQGRRGLRAGPLPCSGPCLPGLVELGSAQWGHSPHCASLCSSQWFSLRTCWRRGWTPTTSPCWDWETLSFRVRTEKRVGLGSALGGLRGAERVLDSVLGQVGLSRWVGSLPQVRVLSQCRVPREGTVTPGTAPSAAGLRCLPQPALPLQPLAVPPLPLPAPHCFLLPAGIFIALLLRFDISLKKNTHTYFYTSFVAYIFGLGLTIFIMHIFKHAQPALLYLVPACIGFPLLVALAKGEVTEMFSYESSAEILPHTPRLTHFPTVSGSPASLADSMQQKLSCPRRRRQQSPSAM
uniref:Histocompatibility minor 13 n=1 Tax=Ficedula albicollis TaxID=59894 RepID=A0A803WGH8_FICAL